MIFQQFAFNFHGLSQIFPAKALNTGRTLAKKRCQDRSGEKYDGVNVGK
jgi:hypothetical protein